MLKKTVKFLVIVLILALGLVGLDLLAGRGFLGQSLENIHFKLRQYYEKTSVNHRGNTRQASHKTYGNMVFSFSFTPEDMLNHSTVPLALDLSNKKDHVSVFQYLNLPAKFVFLDKEHGFELDYARLGNFNFNSSNQAFYEAYFYPCFENLDMEHGIHMIQKIIQTIDNAGWERGSTLKNAPGSTDEDVIKAMIVSDGTHLSVAKTIMVWKAKGYTLSLTSRSEVADPNANTMNVLSEIYISMNK